MTRGPCVPDGSNSSSGCYFRVDGALMRYHNPQYKDRNCFLIVSHRWQLGVSNRAGNFCRGGTGDEATVVLGGADNAEGLNSGGGRYISIFFSLVIEIKNEKRTAATLTWGLV